MPETKKPASRRTFYKLRGVILCTLSKGRKTINQISSETGINWRTVELHLTYLAGKGLISEVFSSSYVRIFELSKDGKCLVSKKFSRIKISENNIGARMTKEEVIEL